MAVAGGGIVGALSALLAARRGWDVTLYERDPELWRGASAANEGKVHLGPIFALGDAKTHEVMQHAALQFSVIIEDALGGPVDWEALRTDRFDYLVMPSSMSSVERLSSRYRAMNRMRRSVGRQSGNDYLGERIDRIVDPRPRRDDATGLPAFATMERAIDPLRLRGLVLAELAASPVEVLTSTTVVRIEHAPHGARIVTELDDGGRTFDTVINCAWAWQSALVDGATPERNFRVKCAIRLPPFPGARAVTLVQGPFGDVVGHRDYSYASWYPVGRLTNEHGTVPSADSEHLLATLGSRRDVAERQVAALQELGLLPPEVGDVEPIGGIIVGHGRADIDRRSSGLHSRAEFGAAVDGAIITPLTFKLTTGPLAADRAVGAAARLMELAS